MDTDERVNLTMRAVSSAIDGNADAMASTLEKLGLGSTASQMYGVCCGFAEVAKRAIDKLYGTAGTDRFVVLEELKPGALTDGPAQGFSARFITAYANGDQDNTLALFDTALRAGGEAYVGSVCALLTDVGGLARLALEEAS